jgi:hypothetical protein
MKQKVIIIIAMMSLFVFSNSGASQSDAITACENKIKSIYDVDQFKHVEAEKTGHREFRVHGKVKFQHAKHPFTCRFRKGAILSYHYDGPTKVTHNSDDHHKSHTGRNVAIGIGIAAAIAIAIASSSHKDDDHDNTKNPKYKKSNVSKKKSYTRHIDKEDLEDTCHASVEGRIKRNYHTIRRVKFKHDTIKHDGTSAFGDGRVIYYNGNRTDFSFNCDFNRNGHVEDTTYSIY